MNALQALIESGHAIESAIGLIMLEILFVVALRRTRAITIMLGLVPGLCLMLALLTAVQDGDWRMIAFWMTASLPFHLIDLRNRLRAYPPRQPKGPPGLL